MNSRNSRNARAARAARTARTRALFTAFLGTLVTLAAVVFAPRAGAAPTSRILRIDPVAGVQSGQPLLTTVINRRTPDPVLTVRESTAPPT